MSERIVSALFTVEIHTSPNACPPDQPVGPAQSSIWLRLREKPAQSQRGAEDVPDCV